jgi:hypothetical protein
MSTNLSPVDVAEILATEREDTKKVKAEAIKARQDAEDAQGWFQFLKKHVGSVVANSHGALYNDCEANNQMMTEWLTTNDLRPTADNLEKAFLTLRASGQIADAVDPRKDYEQKAKSENGRLPQQIRVELTPPTPYLGMTREDVLKKMSTPKGRNELRLLMKKNPELRPEVDRLLNERGI